MIKKIKIIALKIKIWRKKKSEKFFIY